MLLSTIWARGRYERLAGFANAARAMGFLGLELNHEVTKTMLSGVKPGEFHIPSVHAPCPNDQDIGLFSKEDILPSSLDEGKRKRAIAMVLETIDLAAHLGACAVVLHLGKVNGDWGLEKRLREAYRQGKVGTEEYEGLKARLVGERVLRREAHVEATLRSLKEIEDHAGEKGIRVGLENRFYYLEIPNHEEMGMILDTFSDSPLYYWHDTGHAQALMNLGFTPHLEWLRSYGGKLLGVHFHDIKGLSDHGIPGQGDLDFARLAPLVPQEALRVCEFDPQYSPQQVMAGREYLIKLGF